VNTSLAFNNAFSSGSSGGGSTDDSDDSSDDPTVEASEGGFDYSEYTSDATDDSDTTDTRSDTTSQDSGSEISRDPVDDALLGGGEQTQDTTEDTESEISRDPVDDALLGGGEQTQDTTDTTDETDTPQDQQEPTDTGSEISREPLDDALPGGGTQEEDTTTDTGSEISREPVDDALPEETAQDQQPTEPSGGAFAERETPTETGPSGGAFQESERVISDEFEGEVRTPTPPQDDVISDEFEGPTTQEIPQAQVGTGPATPETDEPQVRGPGTTGTLFTPPDREQPEVVQETRDTIGQVGIEATPYLPVLQTQQPGQTVVEEQFARRVLETAEQQESGKSWYEAVEERTRPGGESDIEIDTDVTDRLTRGSVLSEDPESSEGLVPGEVAGINISEEGFRSAAEDVRGVKDSFTENEPATVGGIPVRNDVIRDAATNVPGVTESDEPGTVDVPGEGYYIPKPVESGPIRLTSHPADFSNSPVIVEYVVHPGVKPKRFMYQALRQNSHLFGERFREQLDQILEERGLK